MRKVRISMNKEMKLLLTALFVGAFALTSSADVVGFFHVGANSAEVYTASPGDLQPVELLVTDGSGVYGDLTLTLDAASTQFKLTMDSDTTVFFTDPLITSCGNLANDNMWDNGINIEKDVIPGTLTHVLSGLTIGQEYRLQYTATLRYASTGDPANERYEGVDLTTTVGTATLGATAVGESSSVRDFAAASSYLEWIATSTSLDLVFNSDAGSADGKILNGIIVEAIPEPATTVLFGVGALGMLLVRRFRNHA